MKKVNRFNLTAAAIAALIVYTCYKLNKMYAIERAFQTSAKVYPLTNKWIEKRNNDIFYMITWAKDLQQTSGYEDNLEPEDWNRLKIGDRVEVVNMYNDAFTRFSVFIEPGNYDFDFLLLGLEICMLVLLFWKRKWIYSMLDAAARG